MTGSSRLTVLAGPTAVGKGTLAADVREHRLHLGSHVAAPRPLHRPVEHRR